jgi:hypothetical protein
LQFKGFCPLPIGFDLERVVVAVDFDNRLLGDAGEIGGVGTDWMLPPEFGAGDVMVTQQVPTYVLGTTAVAAQFSRSFGLRVAHSLTHYGPPHPPR